MKITVQQNDRHRAILTDLLPYEVPLRFSFLHLHRLFRDSVATPPLIERLLAAKEDSSFMPYCYWIRTGEGRKRQLGLVHPLLLGKVANLYADFGGLIVNLCSKSEWSLRRPVRIAKMYFDSGQRSAEGAHQFEPPEATGMELQDVSLVAEVENEFQEHASSFFVYEPHNLLQRFFTSKELLQLERKFSDCRRIDIAKCFGSIYTHSISWAIKGKGAAKKEKGCSHTFDAQIDELMRRANHGETHGILIGAELSRIFAEIIFQEADTRTRSQLAKINQTSGASRGHVTLGIVDGVDYTVRRYIDDYFIFANDKGTLDRVQEMIEANLDEFKLFVNEKKTENWRRPFITNISATKTAVSRLITEQLDFDPSQLAVDSLGDCSHRRRKFVGVRTINALRLIIGKTDVEYPDVSSFLLKHLQTLVKRKLPCFRSGAQGTQYAGEWIRCVLEVAFYFFCVDIRFRTSILVSHIISELTEACVWLPPQDARETEEAIVRESIALLKVAHQGTERKRLEIASFIISLRGVRDYWRIPESLIAALCLDNSDEGNNPDYFTILAVSFFAADRVEYRDLQQKVMAAAQRRVSQAENLLEDTELFCLALDMLSCPSAADAFKRMIAVKMVKELNIATSTSNDVSEFLAEFSQRTWLFDWRSTVSNQVYLQKKEFSLGY